MSPNLSLHSSQTGARLILNRTGLQKRRREKFYSQVSICTFCIFFFFFFSPNPLLSLSLSLSPHPRARPPRRRQHMWRDPRETKGNDLLSGRDDLPFSHAPKRKKSESPWCNCLPLTGPVSLSSHHSPAGGNRRVGGGAFRSPMLSLYLSLSLSLCSNRTDVIAPNSLSHCTPPHPWVTRGHRGGEDCNFDILWHLVDTLRRGNFEGSVSCSSTRADATGNAMEEKEV